MKVNCPSFSGPLQVEELFDVVNEVEELFNVPLQEDVNCRVSTLYWWHYGWTRHVHRCRVGGGPATVLVTPRHRLLHHL